MNKQQLNGAVTDIAGKLQEETGKLIGSKAQQAKGLHKQVTGKAEARLGDAKQVIKEASEPVKKVRVRHQAVT